LTSRISLAHANHARDAFIRLQMNHNTGDIIFPGMCSWYIVIG